MKLLLAGIIFVGITLSYMSIHAYEDAYMLQCEIDRAVETEILKDLDDTGVIIDPGAVSLPYGVPPGVFSAGAGTAPLERRVLGIPGWAAAQ